MAKIMLFTILALLFCCDCAWGSRVSQCDNGLLAPIGSVRSACYRDIKPILDLVCRIYDENKTDTDLRRQWKRNSRQWDNLYCSCCLRSCGTQQLRSYCYLSR